MATHTVYGDERTRRYCEVLKRKLAKVSGGKGNWYLMPDYVVYNTDGTMSIVTVVGIKVSDGKTLRGDCYYLSGPFAAPSLVIRAGKHMWGHMRRVMEG